MTVFYIDSTVSCLSDVNTRHAENTSVIFKEKMNWKLLLHLINFLLSYYCDKTADNKMK